jgi:hypothetical protein
MPAVLHQQLDVRRFRAGLPAVVWAGAMLGALACLPVRAAEPTGAEPMPAPAELRFLPPLQPQGPVVLDAPYEGGPCCPQEPLALPGGHHDCFDDLWAPRPWSWQILPNNLIYTSYLAGPKEPRFASVWYNDSAPDPFVPSIKNGWMWDMTAGGRVSILRYGSDSMLHPQGFELQVEGAAFVRLDPQDEIDLRSSDYRFGLPLVYGIGRWQTKLAYYHLSAHLGDEAMLKHPGFPRVNYLRDAMVWGNSYYLFDWMRIYGEVDGAARVAVPGDQRHVAAGARLGRQRVRADRLGLAGRSQRAAPPHRLRIHLRFGSTVRVRVLQPEPGRHRSVV